MLVIQCPTGDAACLFEDDGVIFRALAVRERLLGPDDRAPVLLGVDQQPNAREEQFDGGVGQTVPIDEPVHLCQGLVQIPRLLENLPGLPTAFLNLRLIDHAHAPSGRI